MRTTPYNVLVEKNKQQNALIDLAIVEVSKAYVSTVQAASTKSTIVISSSLKDTIAAAGEDVGTSAHGWAWVVSIEDGNNLGSRRIVSSYNTTSGTLSFSPALDNLPTIYPDKIRLSKCMFLAAWNKPIDFFLPDSSSALPGRALTYFSFPMSIEPVGTTTTGEVLNMAIDISNVDKLIGNAVQNAEGMRGNRVIHLRVFDGLTTQAQGADKHHCILDTMYVDTTTISPQNVSFSLESRFNIIGVQVPTNEYSRDWCRWIFLGPECLGGNQTSLTQDTANFPLANATTCDHTLSGANGCTAHKNTTRFGGFPAIPSRGN